MTRYLELAEFLWLAEQVTGVPSSTLAKASRMELADSALHAGSIVGEDQRCRSLVVPLVSSPERRAGPNAVVIRRTAPNG